VKLGKKNKEKAITDHLVEYGLSEADAEALTGQLEKYKELAKNDTGENTGGPQKGFKEREARDINIDGQARMDMARYLLDVNPNDPIDKKVAMSEIPSHALMHLVMSKTLDDLYSKRNGGEKVTPTQLFISNYTTFMRGLNRKSRKEGLQIFETESDKGKEDMGLFPPQLKG